VGEERGRRKGGGMGREGGGWENYKILLFSSDRRISSVLVQPTHVVSETAPSHQASPWQHQST